MGCVSSKEKARTLKSRKLSSFSVHPLPGGGAWKCALLSIVDGNYKDQSARKQKHQSEELTPQVITSEAVFYDNSKLDSKTLGRLLQDEVPEMINVWELMEGLEEEETSSPAKSSEFRAAEESYSKRHLEDCSSDENSSERPPAGHSAESPRSPLCFDSPGEEEKGSMHYNNFAKEKQLEMLVTVKRNFSFSLVKSPSDHQASTPKVILDSTSPLVVRSEKKIEERLNPTPVPLIAEKEASEEDKELLRAFEKMLEQLCDDGWDYSTDSNRYEDQSRMMIGDENEKSCCKGCGGVGLIFCLNCNGSRRLITEQGYIEECHECTEDHGMIMCPLCM